MVAVGKKRKLMICHKSLRNAAKYKSAQIVFLWERKEKLAHKFKFLQRSQLFWVETESTFLSGKFLIKRQSRFPMVDEKQSAKIEEGAVEPIWEAKSFNWKNSWDLPKPLNLPDFVSSDERYYIYCGSPNGESIYLYLQHLRRGHGKGLDNYTKLLFNAM